MDKNNDVKCECESVEFNLDKYTKKVKNKSDFYRKGILVLPYEKWGSFDCSPFMSTTFDFVKWIKHNTDMKENISVLDGKEKRIAALHSAQIWFPLVYLFSDVSLPIYLNLVANYLYDKLRGALTTDKYEVRLEALIEDKKNKITKKFLFEGSYQALKEISKKVDLDKMLENR